MSITPSSRLNPVIITGGFVPRGAYDNSVDYGVGDSVDYNGSSYVMFNNGPAGTLPTNTTYWQVVANKGSTGANGANGSTGSTGPAGTVTANSGVIIGDGVTDGSWQIIVVGTGLSIQRLETGVWVEKTLITA